MVLPGKYGERELEGGGGILQDNGFEFYSIPHNFV